MFGRLTKQSFIVGRRYCAHSAYKRDLKALSSWLDLQAALKNNGRVVSPDEKLLPASECLTFPRIVGTFLIEKSVVVPDEFGSPAPNST